MDRAATLLRLEDLVAEDGAIALLSDDAYDAPENDWWRRFMEVCDSFRVSDDYMPHREGWEPHISLLIRSAFSDIQQVSLFAHHRWTIDDVIGLALSRSNMADSKLGPKKKSFVAAVHQSLAPYLVDDHLVSLVEQSAIIARRPN